MDVNNNIDNTTSSSVFGDELKLGIVKICLFSTFFVLGLIGNSLVLIGIGLNKGMQTSTNLLIFNLALADVLFIIFCIPTTLVSFFGHWPFTEFGCKLAQFINHLSAFISIYLLVFMSIDRYFAVVHAIDSISNYRTTKNTMICIIALWLIGISICIPIGSLFTVIEFGSPTSMYCLLRYLQPDISSSSNSMIRSNITQIEILPIEASFYWLGFVIFLYALPLTIIIILYGLILKFLRGTRGQSVGRSKRRATRMILAVILTYAFCWFFMQLLFISNIILSRNTSHHFTTYMDILTMFANIFAYLNSCTNPILYGFMSKNFRSSFIALLCCHYSKQNLFGINESIRNRHITDNNYNHINHNQNLLYFKSDYLIRTSDDSRCSQLTPMITNFGVTTSSSLSPITNELSPMFSSNDEKTLSIDNTSPHHLTVELNETHRRTNQSDRSPVVSYYSLLPKSY
ncbi:unnamed protein product [Rotaria sordida]|uniref:G-protein coupled receptors family 1 profile domain-containing protein n=1 Tax=Rotaria sordida TaxID=392033 RepID=A0A818IAE2_9BILA|nr:unnamed protein product [Rotaria sordida]CAF1140660.1 unnamed protein product [Rotaria sordida]CAF1162998.1 unnamed protein product [Rotaria sordida]CAF1169869.1 unnamed protein product [Rotaria sordida]CAF1358030.1 unnamed protein product [Rotaria sordida]